MPTTTGAYKRLGPGFDAGLDYFFVGLQRLLKTYRQRLTAAVPEPPTSVDARASRKTTNRRKAQGQYLGYIRRLEGADRKRVKAAYASEGVIVAARLAKQLNQKRRAGGVRRGKTK